jgi:parallel beta-helix repeat protein
VRLIDHPGLSSRAIAAFALSGLVLLLALGAAMGADRALARQLSCGDVVTTDTVLENDVLGCHGPGIAIAADGVTLDLNGHTIAGSGLDFGISPIGRLRDITVENGIVSGFRYGISLDFLTRPTVHSMTLVGNHDGIVVFETVDAVIEHNVAFGNDASAIFAGETIGGRFADNDLLQNAAGISGSGVTQGVFERNRVRGSTYDGIRFLDATGVRFERNLSSDNGSLGFGLEGDSSGNAYVRNVADGNGMDGFLLTESSTGSILERNVADRNGDDGIDLDTPGSTLSRNSADRNRDLGVEAVPGETDGGHNKARHNGNAAQCTNIAC